MIRSATSSIGCPVRTTLDPHGLIVLKVLDIHLAGLRNNGYVNGVSLHVYCLSDTLIDPTRLNCEDGGGFLGVTGIPDELFRQPAQFHEQSFANNPSGLNLTQRCVHTDDEGRRVRRFRRSRRASPSNLESVSNDLFRLQVRDSERASKQPTTLLLICRDPFRIANGSRVTGDDTNRTRSFRCGTDSPAPIQPKPFYTSKWSSRATFREAFSMMWRLGRARDGLFGSLPRTGHETPPTDVRPHRPLI